VPEGAARSAGFAARARDWLAPWLGGAFDVDAFRRAASRPTLTGHLRDDWSPITDQSSDN
jgi:hypothetical protein